MDFVFDRFISNPTCLLYIWSVSYIYCRPQLVSDNNTISSANLKLMFKSHLFQSSLLMMVSSTAIKSLGDSGSPCLTPLFTGKLGPVLSNFTLLVLLLYMFLITCMNFFSTSRTTTFITYISLLILPNDTETMYLI